ncbi:GGDEF domain-containing protein [Maricaulaceae bacterium MS644]
MEAALAAVEFMAERGLGPTPENFRVWTAYVSKTNLALCEAVDSRTTAGDAIDEAYSAKLFATFFSYRRVEDDALKAGRAASGALVALKARLSEAVEARREYHGALACGGQSLASARGSDEMRHALNVLISANRLIEQRSSDLERNLQQTLAEMNTLKSDVQALRVETLKDGLTGLANRKRLDEALSEAVRTAHKQARPLSVVMCDIDHFKQFNDTWGHQTGDQVIRFVASVLAAEAAPTYTVARYGGEEFAIVIPDASLSEAGSYAETVRQRIARKRLTRRKTNDDLGHVTISMGVATLHQGEQRQALLERADKNLYQSKRDGRNRVTYETMR